MPIYSHMMHTSFVDFIRTHENKHYIKVLILMMGKLQNSNKCAHLNVIFGDISSLVTLNEKLRTNARCTGDAI